MEGASRHAQRLANEFLEDLDTMQRASRARDRRAMSHLDIGTEPPVTAVVHKTFSRRPPSAYSRMGSVPPVTTYSRPIYYTSDVSSVPRTHYGSTRYISDSPYYMNPYTETFGPTVSTRYSTAAVPTTRRYTYYYPSVGTGKHYYQPTYRTSSYTSLSPEVTYEKRRIERRMDDLLDYKLPSPDYYRAMRGSLRGLHDKLDEHRRLLDRYSVVEMDPVLTSSVGDRIESKYQQLASRMGRGYTVTARA